MKIEQALKQSKAKYKAIVEEQTELICRYRQDSTISFVNDAYCRYFDLDKSELIDREFAPLVYDEDRDQVAQMISSMNQTNPTVTIEHRVWVKGKLRWNQWNNRIICDITGEDCEYQAVGRDITSLKEIEIRLRESEEKFRRAFEDAATGEALVTPDGKLLQVNRSLCEMLGYDETELLGKTFQELTHPDDLNLDLDNVQQMLAGEIRSYQMEKRYFHHRGYVVWVLLSVSLVRDIDGKPIYFISQVQDIDRRKRAETELNALVSELERSNQELDEFATVVSHDLTSPLRKQLILIDLVREEYGDVLAEAGKDYLTKIVGYNLRMKNLVDSLLTYARVTTKAEPFVRVALNEVISDVLYNLEPEIAQAQATLEVGDLPTIKGDRLQLNQLFLNLLQNALKFNSCDRLPQIKIEYHLEGDRHQIAIVDNGIGFEPEQQLKIFIPFHRLHGQSKYNGTGLGLAICTKIVHRHQGIITAASQPNKGTTFTISLPSNSL